MGKFNRNVPIKFVLFLSAIIFIAESIIMLVIENLKDFFGISEFILDPMMLIILLLPALYFFLFKPLFANLQTTEKALNELNSAKEIIERQKRELQLEVERQTVSLRQSLEIQESMNSAFELSIKDLSMESLLKRLIEIFLKPKISRCAHSASIIVRDKRSEKIYLHETRPDEFFRGVKTGNIDNLKSYIERLSKDRKAAVKELKISDSAEAYFVVNLSEADPNLEKFEAYMKLYTELTASLLQRRHSQIMLKEERETLAAVFQSALVAIITADKFGKILRFNKAAEEMFGYRAEDLIGKNLSVLMPEPHSSAHDNYLHNYSETGVKHLIGKVRSDLKAKKSSGEMFYIELAVNESELNGEPIYVASISDISKRIENEKQLLITNTAINEAANTIVITDTDGHIIYANPSFTKLTGYSLDEVIGKKTSILKSGKHFSDFYKELWDTVKSGGIWKGRIINKKKSGELYYEEMIITPVKNNAGEILNFISIKHDVTKTVENEKRIRKYIDQVESNRRELEELNSELEEANESKDKFFSIVAHDLKSPFSALLGYTQIFKEEFDELSPEEIKSFTESISVITSNIYQLLLDLLDWARIQTGRMEIMPTEFNIYMIVMNVMSTLKPVAEEKKITLEYYGEKSLSVYADENMIKTVVRNLISNAIKFTRENGVIKVSISLNDEGESVICVEDNGVGIPPENLDKLFRLDLHHTTPGTKEEKGTGLGLILCKEMVEKNNGCIWVESSVDVGSKFLFTLPLVNN